MTAPHRIPGQRRTVLLVFAGVLAVAAALAVVLVLVNRGGSSSSATTTAPATQAALLRGIPQDGVTLGDPKAPALYEYVDMQCPYCGDFSREVMPTVIREYVRTGKLKVVFRGLAFLGPDSSKALQAVYSAGQQNRLWDVAEQLFELQGAENSGWVTDELLDQVGGGVAGLDTDRWRGDMSSDAVAKQFTIANDAATAHGVRGTPTIFFGDQQLALSSLTPDAFRGAIDPLLSE